MQSNSLTIGKKITLGFFVVLAFLVAMVIVNTRGVNKIVHDSEEVIAGNKLDGLLAQKEVDHLNWVSQVSALLNDSTAAELTVETDHTKCGFGKWLYGEGRKEAEHLVPSLVPLLKSIEGPHKALHDSAIAIKEVFAPADSKLPTELIAIEVAHLNWASRVRDAIINKSTSLENVETDPGKCGLGKWLLSDEAKTAYNNSSPKFKQLFDSIRESHSAMHTSANQLKELLAAQNFDAAIGVFQTETLPRLNETIKILEEMVAEAEARVAGKEKAAQIYTTQTLPAVHEVQETLAKIRQEARSKIMTDDVMVASAVKTRLDAIVFGIGIFLIGVGFALYLARSISKILHTVARQMANESEKVSAAADQILSSSQVVADGSSSQAASVEEISATMEEITAMTRQDTDNARHSETLLAEATGNLTTAEDSMQKLTSSMHEISEASNETNKIVKTIDEIAFQTNLLALNAAVEAARAGEAGAGFAVVADEVRNLAMRATEAAKNTSSLIEGTIQKIKNGSSLALDTNEAFTAVSQSITKINTAVSEIASSAKERAIAISQVTTAITQVDSVTQQNAAIAQETASASSELNLEVKNMQGLVNDLLTMVGGEGSAGHAAASNAAPAVRPTPAGKMISSQAARKSLPSPPKKAQSKPEQVIPLDEKDDTEFQDF